jgi:pimeloyl-ACP methyl ester carboxylesterase
MEEKQQKDPHCYLRITRETPFRRYSIVPYLRGYGPTRFLSADMPRLGEQAALASDLRALLDALASPKAVVGGYDWGGRGCCIVSTPRPERGSRSSPEICGMVTLQALKTAKALGITTQADRKEDISCHVLRFPTERLFTASSTITYGRWSAQPRC